MSDQHQSDRPTQKTRPRGVNPKTGKPYEPVEIPVPKRKAFESALKNAAHSQKGSKKDR
jgi:hypothetical protein